MSEYELHRLIAEYESINELDCITENNIAIQAEIIRKALAESNFSKSKTAEKLGISRTSLWRKLKNL